MHITPKTIITLIITFVICNGLGYTVAKIVEIILKIYKAIKGDYSNEFLNKYEELKNINPIDKFKDFCNSIDEEDEEDE